LKNVELSFTEIHTKKKRENLVRVFEEVSAEIHSRFKSEKKLLLCPVCGGASINFFVEKFGYPIDRCESCNHIFTNPFPSLDALYYFYNSDYKNFENEYFEESFDKRKLIFYPRAKMVINKVGSKASILDIGGAVGIFASVISETSPMTQLTVCDLSSNALERLTKRLPDVPNIVGDFMELDSNKKWDAITMWDTFEHITAPQKALKKIRELLKSQGIFIFSTPNTDSFEWRIRNNNHIQLLPPGHVNLYNKTNISMLLQREGFNVDQIYTLNPDLDISYLENSFVSSCDSRVEGVMLDFLKDDQFRMDMISYLRRTQQGGNMVVVCKLK
jgi:SAM-dependent methyltransferase